MPTYTIYADSAANTYKSLGNQATSTWSAAISPGPAIGAVSPGYLISIAQNIPDKSGAQYVSEQILMQFDCSSISSSETVTSVAMSTQHTSGGSSSNSGLTFDCFQYSFSTPIATSAWRSESQLGSLTKVASCTNPSSTATVVSWTSNGSNFNSAINIGSGAARTQLLIVSHNAVTGTDPAASGQDYELQMDNPGGTNPPKLVITTSSGAAATGSGSLSLSASGAGKGADSGSGALVLSASGTAGATDGGSGSITLAATGSAIDGAAGTAAVSLAAGATAGATSDTGVAALTLTGSAAPGANATGAGTIGLTLTGGAYVSVAGSGSVSLTAGGSDGGGAASGAALSLSAAGAVRSIASSLASLGLAASATVGTTSGGAASLSLIADMLEELVAVATGTTTVSSPRGRWIVQDPATASTFIFPLNPNKMTTPLPTRAATDMAATSGPDNVGPRTSMAGSDPVQWQFQGFAHDLTMLQTLKNIFNLQGRVLLTDHLGRQFLTRFLTVDYDEHYPTVKTPYRYAYTVQAISYGPISPMGAAMGPEFAGFGVGGFGVGPFGG